MKLTAIFDCQHSTIRKVARSPVLRRRLSWRQYRAPGLPLLMQITCLPEYYVYSAEKELLSAQAGAIATHIPHDSVIVELGCGDSSKTAILLEALLRRLHGLVSGTGEGGCRARSAGPEGWRSNGSSNSGSSRGSSRGEAGWPPLRFVGVDVSAEALRQTARNLARLLPELPPEQARQGGRSAAGTASAAQGRNPAGAAPLPGSTGREEAAPWRATHAVPSHCIRLGSPAGNVGWPFVYLPLAGPGHPVHGPLLAAHWLAPWLLQVELVEGEYLQGIRRVRQRHPDAFLTVLWLGSSGGAGVWFARGEGQGKGQGDCGERGFSGGGAGPAEAGVCVSPTWAVAA